MSDYLKNPVPFLSDNNVNFVCDKMKDQHNYFIEYGMGSSTLYFAEKFTGEIRIVSVENTIGWFNTIVRLFKQKGDLQEITNTRLRYTIAEQLGFIKQLSIEAPGVPPALSRRDKWKEAVLCGPFMKLSPRSPSRFSMFDPLWLVLKWPFIALNFLLTMLFPSMRFTRGEFIAKKGKMSIICRNVPPAIKDQFGESPSAGEYIEAGLKDLREDLRQTKKPIKAAFFIDGGPRAEILKAVLKIEDEFPLFYPTVFLCEAHRAYYNGVMALRPSGYFVPGSNITIKGQVVQPDPGTHDKSTMAYLFGKETVTKEELAKKEIWFYEKKPVGVPVSL